MELKRKRSMVPTFDEHGHANPFTIRYFNSTPLVHVHHHEETFFELFYDLIIVVVLMKLSYLKYDFSWEGFFTVVAIFANFWSTWSLLNVYVTMIHQEDMLHRFFYALHVVMSFIMCLALEHPDFNFFDYGYQAFFLVVSGIILRMSLVAMWFFYWRNDKNMRAHPHKRDDLPQYTEEQVFRQVLMHGGSIFTACVLFAITCYFEYDGDPEDEVDNTSKGHGKRGRRSLFGSSSSSSYGYGSGGQEDEEEDKEMSHVPTIMLWIMAVAVETTGSVYGSIYERLPFSGEYAGERMQAWLMLCFGESVIGLLINPLYYDSLSIKSILASFVMVFCLVTVYFDITDADKFLHLFLLRGEKFKAFLYCVCHCPFSLYVFFIGVALKTINYIELTMHDIEVSSGCGHESEEHLRRQLLEWGEGGTLDTLAAKLTPQQFGEWLAGSAASAGTRGGGGLGRLLAGSFTIDDYEELNRKSFNLLCFGTVAVQCCSVLVAYAMPTDQDMRIVNLSRFGSVLTVFACVAIPFNLKRLNTDCLRDYEDSHRRRLGGSSYASSYSPSRDLYASGDSEYSEQHNPGLTIVEGLIICSFIVFVSFSISLFSIDVDRAHTYKELEEAAHDDRPPELKKVTARKVSLADRGGVTFVANSFGGGLIKVSTKAKVVPHIS